MDTSDQPQLASAERVARNEAVFRDANETIEDAARRTESDLLPALCECADPRCTDIVRLSVQEYERVRANGRWFVTAVGHQVNADGWGDVVGEGDGYVIVEKRGEAGEIAEQLDRREEVVE